MATTGNLPCLLTDLDNISNVYRGPSKDASYQVLIYFVEKFHCLQHAPKLESDLKKNIRLKFHGDACIYVYQVVSEIQLALI
jgi:hypothetical protein